MTQLGDLSDDCLIEVLERVSKEELFKLQRLNKRLKRLAGIKMGVKIKAIVTMPKNNYSSDCSHTDSLSPDQVLVLKLGVNQITADSYTQFILSLLSKCFGVKSIDFGYSQLTCDTLLESFRRCPDLECVKLHQLFFNQDEWDRVLDEIGQRIVHLAVHWHTNEPSYLSSHRFLETVAKKCNHIKLIDWVVNIKPISELKAEFKLLPKSCWIRLACHELADGAFEDVVDELNCTRLNWSQLGHRYDRLSKLKFDCVDGPVHGVEFNGLKRLDINPLYEIDRQLIDHLIACRFPQLEVFCFNAGYAEDDYEGVFQQMTSIKRLIFKCGNWMMNVAKLPEAAIHQLKSLETIDLIVLNSSDYWKSRPKIFFQPLEQYDKIKSLKKLTVDLRKCKSEIWQEAAEEVVERVKLKQNRVEVVLIAKLIS